MAKTTRLEWEAKGAELFGDDMTKWRFVCPTCKLVMSIERARAELPELKGCGWRPESECIGRYTKRTGCDWAAYGLLHGPLFVDLGDGKEIPAFDFDGEPFTFARAAG